MDETVAEAGGGFGLLVADCAKVVTGHVKTLPVQLTGPSPDWNFPVGVTVEKAADDADTDHLAWRRRWRQWGRRKALRDDAADDVAIELLQRAVVFTLVGEQERMAGADRLDQIAFDRSALEVLAECAQFHFICRTALRNFGFTLVDNWQFGKARGEPRFRVRRLDCQRLLEIASRFFVAADFQQQTAALVPGFGIARIDFQCDCKIVDRIVGAVEA